MNTKVLVQTLTQIPDMQLLQQLTSQIHDKRSLLLPDPSSFFHMLTCLYSCSNKHIKIQAIQLYRFCFSFLMRTQLQQSWNQTSIGIMRMVGEQDAQIRKKCTDLIMQIIEKTNNANIVLQKLYYEGIQNESILVQITSIKTVFKILETYTNLLDNKTSIRMVKLILQKMIALTMSNKHIQLCKNAKQFLQKLFYLKIQKLDEVLTLMNPKVLEHLESIWAKNKQKMMEKQKIDDEKQLKNYADVKYQHLPLINGKFFGVYQPYVLKNLFNPEVYSARNTAIKHFREIFQNHFDVLQKYINIIFKVVVKFIEQCHYDLLMMVKKIALTHGINNVVNLCLLPQVLVPQLKNDNVPYRKQLRIILQKLNFEASKQAIRAYQQQMQSTQNNWISLYQIVCLVQHWIDHHMQGSYPPTLNKVLKCICFQLNSSQTKLRQKCLDLLLTILDRYPGYRENLQDHFSNQKISEIEDLIERRKNKGRGTSISQQAEQIFIREYQEQRQRFIKYNKSSK